MRDTLVELWQANAAGRYHHAATSTTRRSTPISPAPARSSPTTRGAIAFSRSGPARIRGATRTTPGVRRTSISRCSAPASCTRLITQMYFPGDPLLAIDPIFHSIPDAARARAADRGVRPGLERGRNTRWATLGHRAARPRRDAAERRAMTPCRPARRRSGRSSARPRAAGLERPDPRRRARASRSASRASCSTATARRCPTRCSNCGRPMRTGRYAHPDDIGPRAERPALSRLRPRVHRRGRRATGSAPSSPAPCRAGGALQAPHANVSIFARGLLKRLVTRIYFADEAARTRATRCCRRSRTPACARR